MIGRILYLAVPTYWLYNFMDWMLCSVDWWQVQTWQMLCGLKQYWPTWISKRVTGTSGQKRWNTRYPKYPMILKKNRVRIGYCQKLWGRVLGTRQALLVGGVLFLQIICNICNRCEADCEWLLVVDNGNHGVDNGNRLTYNTLIVAEHPHSGTQGSWRVNVLSQEWDSLTY